MSKTLISALLMIGMVMPIVAAPTIRVLPRQHQVSVDGQAELATKRIPMGALFILTVNKGQDVRFYDIQWFKDGIALPGETSQELRYPIATQELEGVYTVQMSSPCATVMSKPIQVFVQDRSFQLNSETGNPQDGVAGHRINETSTASFVLNDCKPNPVTDRTSITFSTSETAAVTLKVVDLNGNVVATLVNDVIGAGEHTVEFNTREQNMSSELYYFVLTAPGFTSTKPLMLVK